jgi:FkbM family methyltransferase
MDEVLTKLDRLATKLRIRPAASFLYWRWVEVRRAFRTLQYRKHRLRSDTYQVTVGDAQAAFHVPTRQEFLDFSQLKERPILAEILANIRPDDVFYDIGANLGLYSCLVADIVDPVVVTFEPHPGNADRLAQNASLNDASVSVFRRALAASAGTTELRLAPGFDVDRLGSAGHSLVGHDGEEPETIPTEKQSGDEFVAEANHPPPTVLKIDVEGAELDVLRGFESTLSRPDCRLVYCEIHEEWLESQGHSVSAVVELLESCGFHVETRKVEGHQPFFRAEKPAADDSLDTASRVTLSNTPR